MRQVLRKAVLIFGAIQLLLGLLYGVTVLGSASGPIGGSIARGVAGLTLGALVPVVPGLLLAWRDRYLPLAFALVAVAPLAWFVLMAGA
jgi:hypothetical protein